MTCEDTLLLITVEENVVAGGAGSAVAEFLTEQGLDIEIRHVAIDDRFIDHASQGETRADAGLSCDDILSKAGASQVNSAQRRLRWHHE